MRRWIARRYGVRIMRWLYPPCWESYEIVAKSFVPEAIFKEIVTKHPKKASR